MIYNSLNYSNAFAKIDAIYIKVTETPSWFNGKKADYAVIRDVPFDKSHYNAADGIMRAGGSSVAVFDEIKTNEIVIVISEKLSDDPDHGKTLNVSDIVVLGV